jgi:hypothetical protein
MLVAIIYVKRDCPICQSIFRLTIIKGATIRKCVPIVFKDVDMVPLSEKKLVWSYEFDPNLGLVFRVYVPYLVIADVDEGNIIKKVIFKMPLIPKHPIGFSEAEVREIIYTTHAWCGYGKALSKDVDQYSGGAEPDEKPMRRRRSPRSSNI